MTDAGIDGKLYPFTYWLTEEDDRRIDWIVEKTGAKSADEAVASALKFYKGALEAEEANRRRLRSCSFSVFTDGTEVIKSE